MIRLPHRTHKVEVARHSAIRSLVVAVLLSVLIGCAPRQQPTDSLAVAQSDVIPVGPCRPYGAATPLPAMGDPILGNTPVPTRMTDAIPTCTPRATAEGTPFPTLTPLPTAIWGRQPGTPPITVSSAPQNLSLSPWDDVVGRVSAGAAGIEAVTWHGSGGSYVTLRTSSGTQTLDVADILGTDAHAAVAVSPAGRIHLAAGGAYAYSDDRGSTWSTPISAPIGQSPHLVVEPTGYARCFWLSESMLYTALQQPDGTWGRPSPLLPGTQDYDAIRVQGGVVAVAAATGSTGVFRFPDPGGQVMAFGSGGSSVNLTYRRGEVLIGLSHDGLVSVHRSLDDGHTWSGCTVQRTTRSVDSVAAVPTAQGPYVALWVLNEPSFPFVVLSKIYWPEGQGCAVWPEEGEVDRLFAVAHVGPPGLFALSAPQVHFRLAAGESGAFIAFEGLTDDGAADVYVADIAPDGLFSAPSLGGARRDEGAP